MRLVLCDDNHILCEALAVALEARAYRAPEIAATTGGSVVTAAGQHADACPLDFCLHRGEDGLGGAQAIRDPYPDMAVLVVSGLSERAASLVATQIRAGGFLGQDQELDRIAALLDIIAAGRSASPPDSPLAPGPGSRPPDADVPLSTLTPRETEVLRRIAAGQNTMKMAREMDVTTETLRTYVKKVLVKLGAHSRLEAAALATRHLPAGQQADHDHPLFAALTPREREVLVHLAKGSELRDVAQHLHMSLKTAHTHLHNLRGKLGVHSTLEAVTLARAKLGRRPALKDPGRPARRDLQECSTLSDGVI